MKYIILFLVFFLTSCSQCIESTQSPVIHEEEEFLFSRILFVWKNPSNAASYNIIISCKDNPPQWLSDIGENETVDIILMDNCKKQKIPKEVLDALTSKKFYYVYWDFYFRGDDPSHRIYQLDNNEATKIGKAPWKIQAIEGVSREQAKIIRNTKNTTREAFEPTWNRDFYTDEEANKCDIYWKWSENIQDEKIWKWYSTKVLKCYRDLPPLM